MKDLSACAHAGLLFLHGLTSLCKIEKASSATQPTRVIDDDDLQIALLAQLNTPQEVAACTAVKSLSRVACCSPPASDGAGLKRLCVSKGRTDSAKAIYGNFDLLCGGHLPGTSYTLYKITHLSSVAHQICSES